LNGVELIRKHVKQVVAPGLGLTVKLWTSMDDGKERDDGATIATNTAANNNIMAERE